MCNKSSRNLVLWLSFLILLLCLSLPIPAQADSTNVPWLSGGFSSGALFSVSGTWQDYQWSLDLPLTFLT